MYKIGFACLYKHKDKNLTDKEILKIESQYNVKTLKLSNTLNLSEKEKEFKVKSIIENNLYTLKNLVEYVSSLPENLKMLRISSDLLPFYNHEDFKKYYSDKNIKYLINNSLKEIGEISRKENIRLSMHPDQFCVLASDRESVIKNSIAELEYHADIIRCLGYGIKFQDFKCNIHISGANGVEGMKNSFKKLSKELLNTITIENDEKKFGIDECLKLKEYCPIVLDIHHYWCREGNRIQINDVRINDIIESWRGIRPVMHYSQSVEELSNLGQSEIEHFDFNLLINKIGNRKDLFKHSNMLWNKKTNEYAKEFLSKFDIMVEAKFKNIASIDFYDFVKEYKTYDIIKK